MNAYFPVVKKVLDECIEHYCFTNKCTRQDVALSMRAHIQATELQHQNPDPSINYHDPLCRLGYLYVHAGANGCLFERTIQRSRHLGLLVDSLDGQSLSICTIGGGPGTELLGLTKYLALNETSPARVQFTVLDRIQEWGEVWEHLSNACEAELNKVSDKVIAISKSFYAMNVMDAVSYRNFAWLFKNTDIFIFNYLLSENQVSLDQFTGCLKEMIDKSKDQAVFVVIDRLERQTLFRSTIRDLLIESGLRIVSDSNLEGCIDEPESGLGDYPTMIDRHPRRWFRTRLGLHPTVFYMVATKETAKEADVE